MRDILGMRARQLAERLQVTQPTVAAMEKSEAAGTVTLASLRKAAAAMGCRFVYAFVPEDTFDSLVRRRAFEAAVRLLDQVDHTMVLEAQGADPEAKKQRVDDLADDPYARSAEISGMIPPARRKREALTPQVVPNELRLPRRSDAE